MTFEQFDEFQQELIDEVIGMKDTKGQEYANRDDRLGNFKRLAGEVMVDPTVVCWIYLKKHLDSIASYVRHQTEFSSEPIRGRIVDAITYLTLLAGLIKEKENNRAWIVEHCKTETKKLDNTEGISCNYDL